MSPFALHVCHIAMRRAMVTLFRCVDEIVVRAIEQLHHGFEARHVAVAQLPRGQALACRCLLHLLTVLVGAGKEIDVVAVKPHESRNGIGRDRLVGVTDVRWPVRVRDRCGDVERRLGRHLPIQFKDMDGRKSPAMTIEEYVSIASRWGKQRQRGSCGRRAPSVGQRHDTTDRFARCMLPAQDRGAGCDFDLALLSAAPAVSAPMRCSGEEKVCIAACKKSVDRSSISTCLTNCGLRQSACMKSGCWDSGPQRYCGLLKQ